MPASRVSGDPNHCGGSRAAAAPDTDLVAVTVTPGPGIVARLREALRNVPEAPVVVVRTDAEAHHPAPLAGDGRVGGDITVIAVPVTDTCKEVVDGLVLRTIQRDTLVDARGPWTFPRDTLILALDRSGSGAGIGNMIELCQAARLRVRVLVSR